MNTRSIVLALTIAALSMTALIDRADGSAVVVEGSAVTVSPAEPTHDGIVTVNATVLFIDATPKSVTLLYSVCTESYCGLDTPVAMVRVGDTDVWTATIGPFPKEDSNGDPFVDLRVHVVAKGTATDGGTDPEDADSGVKLVYFKEEPSNGGSNDSPIGISLAIAGIVAIAIVAALRRPRS